jgi:hypothetical protein
MAFKNIHGGSASKRLGEKFPETYLLKKQQQHVYPCMIMELNKIKSRYI